MLSHCARCTEREDDCCTSDYAKFMTLNDATRIALFLDKPVHEFAQFEGISTNDRDTDLFREKKHSYYYDLLVNEKILQLKKKSDGSCIFFKERRCTIHSVRPLACQAYPFWYKKEGQKIQPIIDDNGYVCPIIQGSFEELPIDRTIPVTDQRIHDAGETFASLQKALQQLDEEMEEYKKEVLPFVNRYLVNQECADQEKRTEHF